MAINKRLLVKPPSTGITPSEHFGVVLYEGDGSSSHSINGGKFGAGAYFNGSNSKIIYPTGYPFNQANSIIAVSAWVKLPTAATEFVLLGASSTSDSNDYITLIVGGNKAGRIFIRDASGSDELQANFGSTNDTNWNHYVWQLSATNGIELWVNGVSQTRTVTNQTGGMTTSSWFGDIAYASGVNYHTGINRVVSTAYYKAKVDQMRLFTKELSSSEVSTLYAETAATVESLDPLSEDTTDTLQVLGDSSCIATYRFENNEDDESGNYDGTGTAIQYAAGRYGQAASFNGSSSKITTSAKPLNNNTSISISFWAKNISVSDYATLIGEGGNSSYAGYKIQIKNTNDGNMALVRSAGGGSYIIPDSYYYDFGTDGSDWVHCVFTVSTTEMKYYKNGQNVLTQSVSNTSTVASTYNLNMMFDEQYSKYVGGQLDQVRIFNKTLSQAEVTTLYNENSLVASYRFEGNANDDTRNYDGTASNVTYEYGLGFTPDLVWIKDRGNAEQHVLNDSTRGATKDLSSNTTAAEATRSTGFLSFDDGGFTLGSDGGGLVNDSSRGPYVAWCWKANGGTTSTNNDGNIASTVQLNADAGFAITKVTGSGSTDTFGHGLGTVPEVIIRKNLDATDNWNVYTTLIDGSLDFLKLNLTDAKGDSSYTAPTSTVFTNPGDTNDRIYYSFVSVAGFSKFGTYTGNADNNGPIVETGFEPAFLMIKRTSATDNWVMIDNRRSPINPKNNFVWANKTDAETTFVGTREVNFYSNGFQPVSDGADDINDNNAKYFYMAFAADPDTEAPVVAKSFNAAVYSGNLSANGPIVDIGFNPGFVWIKAVETTSTGDKSHRLHDVVRGQQSFLKSDTTDAASRSGDRLNFNYSDTQIQITNASKGWNDNGYRYVAWAWKANDNEPTTLYDSSAIAAYKFEDNANDVGGNYNATTTSVTYVSGGKFNKAVRGVASNSKVALNYTASDAFTFSLWIYNESTSGAPAVIAGMGGKWVIGWESNKVWMLINDSNRGSGYTISTNTWYHVAATYDGSGTTQLYVDGTLRETITGQTPSSLGSAKLFSQDLGYWSVFAGRIDQVRIYSVVLNSTQISSLYNESASDNSTLEFPDGLPNGAFNSTVSANANAGFSIVKWDGTGTQRKIQHGLSAAPEMIISKRLDTTNNWSVYHKDLGLSHTTYPNWMYLNLISGVQNSSSSANHPYYAVPSSTVIYQNTGTSESTNVSGGDYISYCFHSVSGFSKIGSYTGNGSAGQSITTGFQPDWVLIKTTVGNDNWRLYDTVRNRGLNQFMQPNNTDPQEEHLGNSNPHLTMTSTGFTITADGSSQGNNSNGNLYTYAAFKIN